MTPPGDSRACASLRRSACAHGFARARHGLDDGASVAGIAAAPNLETLASMDNLLSTAERRYSRALQEIGAYRSDWRAKLGIAAGAVIDGAPALTPIAAE